jgi:hypothetical protein
MQLLKEDINILNCVFAFEEEAFFKMCSASSDALL